MKSTVEIPGEGLPTEKDCAESGVDVGSDSVDSDDMDDTSAVSSRPIAEGSVNTFAVGSCNSHVIVFITTLFACIAKLPVFFCYLARPVVTIAVGVVWNAFVSYVLLCFIAVL